MHPKIVLQDSRTQGAGEPQVGKSNRVKLGRIGMRDRGRLHGLRICRFLPQGLCISRFLPSLRLCI